MGTSYFGGICVVLIVCLLISFDELHSLAVEVSYDFAKWLLLSFMIIIVGSVILDGICLI